MPKLLVCSFFDEVMRTFESIFYLKAMRGQKEDSGDLWPKKGSLWDMLSFDSLFKLKISNVCCTIGVIFVEPKVSSDWGSSPT